MKLTLKERLGILNILPKQGDFVTMTAKADLVDKIKVTQEEIKELHIETIPEGGLKWDGKKDLAKEFEITDLETKIVKDELKRLDDAKQISDEILLIYKKFN